MPLGCPITTNIQQNGADLGSVLVEKSYMQSMYPSLVPWEKASTLWIWGDNFNGRLGNNSNSSSGLGCQSSPIQTISAGSSWRCASSNQDWSAAVKTDGTLWTWGRGICGTLGNNSTANQSSPVQTVAGGTNWVSICTQPCIALATKSDGTLWVWGVNSVGVGQLGTNDTVNRSSPTQIAAAGPWKNGAISLGHGAAVRCDGTLWTWGGGYCGAGGRNNTTNISSPAQTIAGGNNWSSVVATYFGNFGTLSTAAIKTDGTLWTWGYGGFGQLGNNLITNQSSPVQTIAGGTNWRQVSMNYVTTAAIKTDGTLWMWGGNFFGANLTFIPALLSSPAQVISGGTNWKCVCVAGFPATFALKTDGTMWSSFNARPTNYLDCSGYEPYMYKLCGCNWMQPSEQALIENDTYANDFCSDPVNFKFPVCYNQVSLCFGASSPVQTVSGGTDWQYTRTESDFDNVFSAGSSRTSGAVKDDGTLWLWGLNTAGVLGNNSTASASSPVQTVSGGSNWCIVSIGGANFAAAIKNDASLWVWGFNGEGQLGTNDITARSSPAQTVAGGTTWTQVSAGTCHLAAIKNDGTLWVWGNGLCGALGNSSVANASSPVQTISGGTTWCHLSAGTCMTGGIKTDGTLWLWGSNLCGSLGNNAVANQSSPVQTVAGGTNWAQISAGSCNAGAIKQDGTLWTWGSNLSGSLGDGTVANKSSPVQVSGGGTNWKQLSMGSGVGATTSGAIKRDGTLSVWGATNANGTVSSPVQIVSSGTNWAQVQIGNTTGMAATEDGSMYTWGCNLEGALGTNNTSNSSTPVQTISGGTVWQYAQYAGYQDFINQAAAMAIKTDGTLWSWGVNTAGILGDGSIINRSSPVQTVAGGTNWLMVSAACTSTFGLKTDGTLWAWGCNVAGVLGTNQAVTVAVSSPVQTVAGGTNWCFVGIGLLSIGAIKNDGTLWMWGCNASGPLGTNSTANQSSPVQTVAGGTNWKLVSTYCGATGAIKQDGTLWTWGFNGNGRLGTNNLVDRSSPSQTVAGGTNWKQLAIGSGFMGAVKTDGTLWTWGAGGAGALGSNASAARSSPNQTISGGTNWKQVSAGNNQMNAVKTDGTLWFWGNNQAGSFMRNNLTTTSSPVQTIATSSIWRQTSIGQITNVNTDRSSAIDSLNQLWSAGSNDNGALGTGASCCSTTDGCVVQTDLDDVFLRRSAFSDGGLWVWGCGAAGALGNNSTANQSSPVQTVSGGMNWQIIADNAAIKSDGTLWLWGDNTNGTIGDNTVANRSSPVQTVSGGSNWNYVSVGSAGTVTTIKSDGTFWAWGTNAGGQLGDNSITTRSSPVQTVAGGTNWKASSAGTNHVLAIKTDGTLWAWGCNSSGQLGDNSITTRSSPVQTVSTGTNWKQPAAGNTISAAIKTDGTLWTWGTGTSGALGNQSTALASSPGQTISGGTNWKQISAIGISSGFGAIKTDGTLWMWGQNAAGAIGDNTTTDRSSPVQTIAGGTNWRCVTGAFCAAYSIKSDGTLWAWGCNPAGELGDSTVVSKSSPAQTVTGGTDWMALGLNTSGGIRSGCW